jgi:hypothetical protein
MRIQSLLQKLNELSAQPENKTAIDVDLMLDYTRVIYADLLEWRSKMKEPVAAPKPMMPMVEPTLAEMTAAMEEEEELEQLRPMTVLKTMEYTAPDEEPEPVITAKPIFIPPARDIRTMIGINDKYQILSEIFGNDKNAYEETITKINSSASESEAIKWLQERLWVTEEHSDAAQSFYDLIRRYFAAL